MPRMGRVVLPNYPHHIVQRGHNRQVVFAAPEDYQRYIGDLRELKEAFGVKVYAYCLMTNHIHLLVTPTESVAGLGQLTGKGDRFIFSTELLVFIRSDWTGVDYRCP